MLLNNHDSDANNEKNWTTGIEHVFGLCETFKKITKGFGINLTIKTADLQGSIYTAMASDITVKINKLNLFVLSEKQNRAFRPLLSLASECTDFKRFFFNKILRTNRLEVIWKNNLNVHLSEHRKYESLSYN